MAFSASMQDHAVAEMNVTPLVDVMLVLLVIFMVSVPIIATPVQASLPQPSRVNTPLSQPVLQLDIGGDGAYRLDGRLLRPGDLELRLAEAVVQGDGRVALAIRSNSDADYQSVVSALALARNSGVSELAVIP